MNSLRVTRWDLKWTLSALFIFLASESVGIVVIYTTGILSASPYSWLATSVVGLVAIGFICCVLLSIRLWVMKRADRVRLGHSTPHGGGHGGCHLSSSTRSHAKAPPLRPQ